MFQYLRKDDKRFLDISNWFISASSNQKTLAILRDMLYQYWEEYDCVIAYFVFDIFFMMIVEMLPEEVEMMPRVRGKYCFYLAHRLEDEYNEEWMNELTRRCCFHKLSGRLWSEAKNKDNTIYAKSGVGISDYAHL